MSITIAVNVTDAVGATASTTATATQSTATLPFLVSYGDSLTYGTGSTNFPGNVWTTKLAQFFGMQRSDQGIGGETSNNIANRFCLGINNQGVSHPEMKVQNVGGWGDPRTVYTLEGGFNNHNQVGYVESDFKRMSDILDAVGAKYVVIGIPTAEDPRLYTGGADRAAYNTIVTNLANYYGPRFVNVDAELKAHSTHTGQDLIDDGHDIVPSSLRSDGVHWNDAGYDVVYQAIRAKFQALGFFGSPPTTIKVPGQNWIQSPTNFAGVGWTGWNVTTAANQGTAIDGSNTLSKIIDNATNGRHVYEQGGLNPNSPGTWELSAYVKQGTLRYVQLAIADNNGGGSYGVTFDTQTGIVTDSLNGGTPTGTSSSIVATTVAGLWLATITMNVAAGGSNVYAKIATSNSATPAYTSGSPSYAGTGQYILVGNSTFRLSPAFTLPNQSPQATAGYLQNTFHVGPFTTSNVDMALAKTSGFSFYLTGTTFYPDVLPSHVRINADGSVTLIGNTGTGGDIGSNLTTVSKASSAPFANWKGTAFGGGAYFEATMSFDPGPINAANDVYGIPAWWADPVEHLSEFNDGWVGQAPGFVHFCELDFFEYNISGDDDRLFAYNGTVIDWSGAWNGSNYPVAIQNSANRRIQLQPPIDFKQPHKYGFLWVPATPTTQGYFQWYFDGAPTSDRVTYSYYDPVNPPAPPATQSSPWLYGVADTHHYQLFLNSDARTSLTIYSVDVWQKSAANNIVK